MTGKITVQCRHCSNYFEGNFVAPDQSETLVENLEVIVNNELSKRGWLGKGSKVFRSLTGYVSLAICSEKCQEKEEVKVTWVK